jgi:hypothetical protein
MLHDLEDLAARLDAIGPTTAGVAAAVRRAARQWSALDVIRRALTDRPDPHAARLRLAASVLTLAAGVVHDATEQRDARDELITSAAALLDLARSMLDALLARESVRGARAASSLGAGHGFAPRSR